ncbi:MAG TPA: outer membrane lipid asymmetry maintenance protein MlaD [Dongiaceae bacterium]|nr:outer membrane lipid asymmetry maintenance protein MlaD [Dongiaceae bacterium]
MQRNMLETVMGALVLIAAAGFLYLVSSSVGVRENSSGYNLVMRFDRGGSVNPGTDVRIAGAKIGTVVAKSFDPDNYQAVVTINVDNSVKLPKDTTAIITSDGLLGDNYVLLEIGGDDQMLKANDQITHVQGALNLADLINKFVVGGSKQN